MKDKQTLQAPFWIGPAAWLIRCLPFGRYRAMDTLARRLTVRGSKPRVFIARAPRRGATFRFHCDVQDGIQREVCFMGKYEPQETAFIEHFAKPDCFFVDVGANWGYFTLLMAALAGPGSRIVSFEPDPRLYSILKKNLELNGFTGVVALQTAASDRAAELLLQGYDESQDNWGISRLTEAAGPGGTVFKVAARSIDDVLDEQGFARIDLLKMDIEGAEDKALLGMERGLKQRRYDAIMLELHPGHLAAKGVALGDALAPLIRNGYSGWVIRHSFEDTRRAAYSSRLEIRSLLQAWNPEIPLDSWPHLLFTAPGIDPLKL